MSRTIDDYDSMARREIIKAKQEKASSYASHNPSNNMVADTEAGEYRSSKATMPNSGRSLSGLRRR
jgi:hypothetical protein